MLNACNSKPLADLLEHWAATTVYWTDSIDDETARAFSSPFYAALLNGETVSAAIAIARADSPQLLEHAPGILGDLDQVLIPGV